MLLSLPSRSIARSARSYANQAAPSIITTTQANSAQKVLSTPEDNKLTASISLFIKAGSRYQPNHGIAHLLKNSVFKSTQKRSALSLVRETELLGGVLTSSLNREHLILSAEFLKGNDSKLTRHEFHEEVLPGAKSEYTQAQEDPTIVAIDQAHQLAFRGGLGNSLFINPHLSASHESVIDYARSSFGNTKDQAIVSTGIEAERLTELVNQFFIVPTTTSSASSDQKSSYHGGEARITSPHGSDTLLVAFKGSEGPSNEAVYTVLQHLLGSDPASVKWSNGTSPFSSLPVKAFHLSYSDIGLFGILVKAPANQSKTFATQALNEIKKIANGEGVDKGSINRAALKARFLVASNLENNLTRTELLGTQSLISPKSPSQITDLYSSYSQVTPDQVIQAAKSIIKSAPTTVAVGNTQELPYFDQLGL
ncbi:hypothetical protein Pst134EA_032312 [Puccinia striiformis f. sp. tritici]|uniref:uncharacterized protein n=1 Tax=Puccinia striiformis f. sp. tritici TaxID=168172 RepID=UPI0020088FEA|nr:uncharacterized protein Pst134EA_032312 [Puccinia striiformis f. sp. tritici]KAH9440746.1 hypothetical protein Pst134EA_032312 [Puccinia striiformis f. sp. tritici]